MMVRLALNADGTPKFLPASRANGPGLRAVLWFQGCSIGRDVSTRCSGCINPWSHAAGVEVHEYSVNMIFDWIKEARYKYGIEGVTFTGGEPFDQPQALTNLAYLCRAVGLTNFAFTGFTVEELEMDPDKYSAATHMESLLCGRYDKAEKSEGPTLFGGSTNQELVHVSHIYSDGDFRPAREIHINTQSLTTIQTGTR